MTIHTTSHGTATPNPDAALAEMGGVRVKPLRWEHHPWGTIAAPPTGHAYIIDTRMKGRVYSLKGFNPQREFASIDEAKAAAQADYEARILAAIEPAPVSVREAARVLLGHTPKITAKPLAEMSEAMRIDAHPAILLRGFCAALRAIAEGKDDD